METQGCFYSLGIVTALERLGNGTLISEKGLAELLGCSPVTIKRAVARDELPPPVRLLGKPTWTAGAILRHFEDRLQKAAAEARLIESHKGR